MTDSILTSVKKFLGIAEDYTIFDLDLIYYINSVFAVFYQLGVGDKFSIIDSTEVWSDYVDDVEYNMIQADMFQRVKLLFDPPSTAHAIAATQKISEELDWRLYIAADPEEIEEVL